MRTTPALRTLAAALLTAGTLAVATAGTTAAAAPPTTVEGRVSVASADDPARVTVAHGTVLTLQPGADWEVSLTSLWNVTVSGTSSGEWEWIPLAR